jgi:hypothetical protein
MLFAVSTAMDRQGDGGNMKRLVLLLVVCSAHLCLAQGIPCAKIDEA